MLIAILFAAPALPQASVGSVRGTVKDQTGAVIPNVSVVLTNTATGVETKTASNEVGIYVFPSVLPGPYRVAAESAGMNRFEATLSVQTQQSANIEITLHPAGTHTLVTVADVTPMLVTDAPTLGSTLERTRIEQLPINGRNVMALLNTVPGLAQDTSGAWRTFGTRVGTHDVSLDGAALTDAVYGGAGVARMPSLDSIQEFAVNVNAASARYARQTNIVLTTKGGTNEFHGTLFETHRNNAIGLARRRQDGNTPAKLIRNEYGGTAGGPVYLPKIYDGRNRTFWFFAYEGFKQREGGVGFFRVPTEAMRNGDFSGLVDSAGVRPILYNPWTTDPETKLRQPFNYQGTPNRIDPALISPLAKNLYSILPMPNIPGVNPLVADNYTAVRPDIFNQYTWTMRFDHRVSDKDQVYTRLGLGDSYRLRPAAAGVPTLDNVGNSRTDTAPNKSLSVNWTRSFSPTFFNEVMFSASRTVTTLVTGDPTRQYATELGLPNPAGAPGYPVINNIGVGTGASNYFQPQNWRMQYFNYFILDNNATKIAGRHEIQFGAHLRYDQLTYMPQQQRTAGAIGSFPAIATGQFDPTVFNRTRGVLNTGHVAASAFLGLANYDVRIPKGKYYMRQNEDALYIQDNIRATSRLTLNLGLRWQFSPYPKDKYDIFTSFDPKTMSIVLGQDLDTLYKVGATSPALVNVLVQNGVKFTRPQEVGYPDRLVKNNWFDIGPKLGFAYRALDGAKAFVIRGGFSTSYFPVPIYGWNDRMRLNSPFTGFYQNFVLTSDAESPDRLPNWGLVSVPTIIAGKNSANAIDLNNPVGLQYGGEAYQTAYFAPEQPSSRVHDWNITIEKEVMRDTIMRVAYVGNHAAYQDSYNDWNQQIPAYVWYETTKQPLPTGPQSAALRRPNPTYPYGNLQEYRRDGWGNSNGAQVQIEKRYAQGIGFQAFYTLLNTIKAAGHGWYDDSMISPVSSYLPGAVPTDDKERMRLLLYGRDSTVFKHEIRWNWIVDMPFGKGKALGGNANRFVDAVIGGWQVTGMGRWRSNYFNLPAPGVSGWSDGSGLWPTGNAVEYYGQKYPIEDCRGGICRPGYLMWNGYIPAHQINSKDANGRPNGYMGVPDNYKPAVAPLYPYPADFASRSAATDPMYNYYGGSTAFITLANGARQEVAYLPLHPYRNQLIASTNLWNTDAAMFKSFSFTERVKLRVQVDFFNVFNTPGNTPTPTFAGFAQTWQSVNAPRTTQLSGRLSW